MLNLRYDMVACYVHVYISNISYRLLTWFTSP